MFVKIEIVSGPGRKTPCKSDIDLNIRAIQRAIDRKPLANDDSLLIYTKSILEGIKEKLPR